MVVVRILLLALIFMSGQSWASDLPDSSITPGAVNSVVTQENIQSTICLKGYTKTIRPPANYTNKLKKRQLRQYGYDDLNPKHYEEDHLIPLEIGGAPRDSRNLWPEPRRSEWSAKKKDQLENKLHKMVCNGSIKLKEAQEEIARDWVHAWKKYVISEHP